MKQVVRNKLTKPKTTTDKNNKPRTRNKPFKRKKYNHPQFGTSKLEEDFARDFLDKLGLEYQYQFEARDIGRYYDFLCNGVLIEIDGDYYHSNPLLFEEGKLNSMQKRNKKIDDYKNEWAIKNGYPILRIWEHDIRTNPKKVMEMLKERFYIDDEQVKVHKTTTKVTPKKKIKKE